MIRRYFSTLDRIAGVWLCPCDGGSGRHTGAIVTGAGFLGTATQWKRTDVAAEGPQRPDGLPALHQRVVLELPRVMRRRRRAISDHPARPDHGRGHAAAGMDRPPGQPQHRTAYR